MDDWRRKARDSNKRTERTVTIIMLVIVLIMGAIAITHMGDDPVENPPARENFLGGP